MAIPDPPPNSLGLDLVRPEPASDPQSSSPSLESAPTPQPATEPAANSTADTDTTTAAAATTPTTDVTKVEDVAKSNVSKKSPYVNPERVKTGGLPRVETFFLALTSYLYNVFRILGQIDGRGTRGENGANAGTERKNQAEETRTLSHITHYLICFGKHLTFDLRMLLQTRTHLNRLKQRNDSDKRIYGRCRRRLIVHASRMRSEKWTRFRVGSGIQKKKGSGGMLSLNCQRQPRRQLHKQIMEEVKQNLRLLGGNVGAQLVDEEREGEAGAAEEGEAHGEAQVNAETLNG